MTTVIHHRPVCEACAPFHRAHDMKGVSKWKLRLRLADFQGTQPGGGRAGMESASAQP